MELNLDKITDKIMNNAELIGSVGGVFAYGMQPVFDNVQLLFDGHGHFPDLSATIKAFFKLPGGKLQTGVYATLAGWILEELKIGGNTGKALKNGGIGFLKGLGIQHVLYYSTHSSPEHKANYEEPLRSGSGRSEVRGL